MLKFPHRPASLFILIRLVCAAVIVGIVIIGAVIGVVVMPKLIQANTVPPDPVAAAWVRARNSGGYRFDGDVVQVTLPSAIPANVGRSSRTNEIHLEGHTDLLKSGLEMQLWSQGGSVAGSAAQTDVGNSGAIGIKVANGKTFIRQASGEWKEDSSVSMDGIAPQGDFMNFLQAVRNVVAHEPETRAGLTFTRYTFDMDGPAFAEMVRDQMEASLRAKGELLPNARLEVPAYYHDMTGTGELGVRQDGVRQDGERVGGASDGLPLRQILTLSFPEQRNESVQAQITVNFLQFDPLPAVGTPGFLRRVQAFLSTSPLVPYIIITLLSLFGIMLLMRFHTQRRLQKAMALALAISMVLGPLLSGIKTGTVLDAQTARAASQAEAQKETDASAALREIDKGAIFNPHQSPIKAANLAADQRAELEASVSDSAASARLNAPAAAPPAQALPTDNGVDTDADGLTDFAEARIGTSEILSDTDDDGVPDSIEVKGFTLGGKTWYLDANAIDSIGDGIGDVKSAGTRHPPFRRRLPPSPVAIWTPTPMAPLMFSTPTTTTIGCQIVSISRRSRPLQVPRPLARPARSV